MSELSLSLDIQSAVVEHGECADAGIARERHVAAVDNLRVIGVVAACIGDGLDDAEVGELAATAAVVQAIQLDGAVGGVVEVAAVVVEQAVKVNGTGIVARSAVGNIERDAVSARNLSSGEDDEASGARHLGIAVDDELTAVGDDDGRTVDGVAFEVYRSLDVDDHVVIDAPGAVGVEHLCDFRPAGDAEVLAVTTGDKFPVGTSFTRPSPFTVCDRGVVSQVGIVHGQADG